MKMFNKDGVEMMDVKSIHHEGDRLVLKGKMMGSMPAVIYLRPQDLWQALRLLSFATFARLPVLLLKGLWQSRRAAAK